MRKLLYIFGVPGSGKTTLVAEALRGAVGERIEEPVLHMRYNPSAIQLGADRSTFGGTDALDMAAQPRVTKFLEGSSFLYVLGEGDRLGNLKFFEWARQHFQVTLVHLDTPPEVAAARRAARGSKQSESWLKGRATKVQNLAGIADWQLDGKSTPETLAAKLREHDVVRSILGLSVT